MNNNFGFVGLVGVQSNQYPRSLQSPSRCVPPAFRCIGGFHVSGCLAMFAEIGPDLQEALDIGHHAVRRRGRRPHGPSDARCRRPALKPVYNYINDLPALEERVDAVPAGHSVRKTTAMSRPSTPDAAARSNARSAPSSMCRVGNRAAAAADEVERILRKNFEHGIDRFFITDDNFARTRTGKLIFDRIIKLREEDGM